MSGPRWARSVTATTTPCVRASLHSLECELLDQHRFRTQAEAKMAVFDYIEGFYNPRRRHSSIGQTSPINFERLHRAALTDAA